MNYGIIFYVIGWVLNFEAAFMLPSCITAFVYHEREGLALAAVAAVSLLAGLLIIRKKPKSMSMYAREGFVTVTLYIRVIRTDIHQVTDISSALSNCIALEQLADLIKQHNSYTFLIIAKQNGADSRDRHQKVFIKYLLIADTFPRLFQNIVSDHQVRNHKQHKLQPALCRKQRQHDDQRCRHDDTDQHFFLLLVHNLFSHPTANPRVLQNSRLLFPPLPLHIPGPICALSV